MTCSDCQLQIFDGELTPEATVHLTECEECRELDREARLNTAALAQLREETLPTSSRPRAPGRWPLAPAFAAAAATIAFLIVSHVEPRLPPPPVPPVAKLTTPAPESPPVQVPVRHHHRVRKPEPKPEPAPEQPLLVKFITADPEVVVYWIVDANQGEPGL